MFIHSPKQRVGFNEMRLTNESISCYFSFYNKNLSEYKLASFSDRQKNLIAWIVRGT